MYIDRSAINIPTLLPFVVNNQKERDQPMTRSTRIAGQNETRAKNTSLYATKAQEAAPKQPTYPLSKEIEEGICQVS